jgi:hypothetical protein
MNRNHKALLLVENHMADLADAALALESARARVGTLAYRPGVTLDDVDALCLDLRALEAGLAAASRSSGAPAAILRAGGRGRGRCWSRVRGLCYNPALTLANVDGFAADLDAVERALEAGRRRLQAERQDLGREVA